MVRIWLPADTYRRLLETLPAWSRAHKALNDATEMHYAVGVRRVSCDLPEALALLQVAERVCPESAPLIRIAIRKARTTHSAHNVVPPQLPDLPGQARDVRPQLLPLRALRAFTSLCSASRPSTSSIAFASFFGASCRPTEPGPLRHEAASARRDCFLTT